MVDVKALGSEDAAHVWGNETVVELWGNGKLCSKVSIKFIKFRVILEIDPGEGDVTTYHDARSRRG